MTAIEYAMVVMVMAAEQARTRDLSRQNYARMVEAYEARFGPVDPDEFGRLRARTERYAETLIRGVQ
jgi:hypothetical protein